MSIAILNYSCTSDNEEDLFPSATVLTVKLSTDVAPIIIQNCAVTGCHVAGVQSPNLSVAANILSNAARVNARAVIARTMPPGGASLTASEIATIKTWIEEGANDN